ncbi:MAG: hypothetical protein JNM00_01125 [Flavobacteriales bacterium]|nr:hypothetical protein [Flavobacteriales bacterium]
MKKSITILTIFSFITASLFATDRIVADGGQGGAYPTITDAVNAAVSGDRILIYPKVGGAMYSENVAISSKSLQLLSAEEGVMWKLNGNITFTSGSAGQELVVQLANIIAGDIQAGAAAPAGARSKVHVLGCQINSGSVLFNSNQWDVNVAGNTFLDGTVQFRYGKVVGNNINPYACGHGILCNSDGTATDDYIYIVGNKIVMPTSSGCSPYDWTGIYFNSTSQFAYITNNFIHERAIYQFGLRFEQSKSSTAKVNILQNNSILNESGSYNYSFRVVAHNSVNEITNNTLVIAGAGFYGFYSNTASINDHWGYNYTNVVAAGNAFANITNDGTNLFNQTITMSNTTGEVTAGVSIDGGSPDNAFLDLDLTRNDADCYGGSFSRANFTQTPTGAMTTFMLAPRRVLSGGTISISAEGFDR